LKFHMLLFSIPTAPTNIFISRLSKPSLNLAAAGLDSKKM